MHLCLWIGAKVCGVLGVKRDHLHLAACGIGRLCATGVVVVAIFERVGRG